MGNISVVQRAI